MKRLGRFSIAIMAVYLYILFKVMVLKDIPVIRIGHMRFKLGGTDDGPPNWVPFRTIRFYLVGRFGLMKAGVNLIGNVVLLIPVGFLAGFIHPRMTWLQSMFVGLVLSTAIEAVQGVFRLGIVDVDDVILNTLGVLAGHALFVWLAKGRISGDVTP
jgi:glycopeptide antibiotics resistance protein